MALCDLLQGPIDEYSDKNSFKLEELDHLFYMVTLLKHILNQKPG
jgi:hypothetical protein